MKKRIWLAAAVATAVLGTALLAACGVQPSGQETSDGFQDGWYVLQEKTVQGTNVTDDYLYNCIYLKNGNASWYEIDYTGKTEQTGTYTAGEDKVTVTIGVRPYEFSMSSDKTTLSFAGKISKKNITMSYTYDANFVLPVASNGVLFTDELFGEDKSQNFYNYCPSVLMEGNSVMHVWYCSNKVSGNVTDHVGYRKGVLNAAGKWVFTEKQLVLAPGTGEEWDSAHVCDPAVTKGSFRLDNETYSYLMAYLGCKTRNNCCNEVGLAVAKAPQGPWIKVTSLNPIANWYEAADFTENNWGYGQPSLVSYDNAGKVILFYAMGTSKVTATMAEKWDLSDLNSPVKLASAQVREKNCVNAGGGVDCINNADFAYDKVNQRLYCIKEDFPYADSTEDGINWITATNVLMYADCGASGLDVLFGDEVYSWNKCGVLSASGAYVRAHNACIGKDSYGALLSPLRVPVLYTVSESYKVYHEQGWQGGGQWPALHTYRIHGTVFDV